MKKILSIALVVVLLAGIAVSGTMAYLTDTDSAVNVMTLGNVKIEQIELQRKEQSDSNTSADNLEQFEQMKSLIPAVGPVEWADNYQNWETGGSNQLFTDKLKNVVDKFVFTKNVGSSDAYVRQVIAFEAGELSFADWDKMMHWNINGIHWAFSDASENAYFTDADGNKYFYLVATYKGNAGTDNSTHPNGVLSKDETTRPSLLQAFLDSEATNETVEAIDGNKNGLYDILVLSQAVQTAGFASAEEALNAGFGEATATNVAAWFGNSITSDTAGSNKEFEDALKNTDAEGTIVVSLTGDVTYDVAAWANEAMGGEKTEKIVINGNGHTITFNQTDSDWNNIVTNGAKLVINNAKVTNSGHNDGPWNRHDLNFACDVELNNVTSDKAMAFKAGAVLKNVTISDANTSDTYAIWIQPNGQTVTLDGCTIDMLDCSDGRGIKIDEQYVSSPAKVTLSVSNTTFKTEEKSAILVKSVAGADITLSNVNINAVTADPINPVWVDEASVAYADLVTVTGGSKIVEP